MFAVIETGGKQYKVSVGDKVKVEKLATVSGENFVFDKILLISDEVIFKLGHPYLLGAQVEAKIVKQARDRKKIVFKYHAKARYRKKKGHRQSFTEAEITKISG